MDIYNIINTSIEIVNNISEDFKFNNLYIRSYDRREIILHNNLDESIKNSIELVINEKCDLDIISLATRVTNIVLLDILLEKQFSNFEECMEEIYDIGKYIFLRSVDVECRCWVVIE